MPEKTPADRKDGSFKFTVKGKSYSLPPITESTALDIPGSVTYAAIMSPDDEMAQIRLAFATLEAAKPSESAMKALKSLSTKQMIEEVGRWMGESSGSSD